MKERLNELNIEQLFNIIKNNYEILPSKILDEIDNVLRSIDDQKNIKLNKIIEYENILKNYLKENQWMEKIVFDFIENDVLDDRYCEYNILINDKLSGEIKLYEDGLYDLKNYEFNFLKDLVKILEELVYFDLEFDGGDFFEERRPDYSLYLESKSNNNLIDIIYDFNIIINNPYYIKNDENLIFDKSYYITKEEMINDNNLILIEKYLKKINISEIFFKQLNYMSNLIQIHDNVIDEIITLTILNDKLELNSNFNSKKVKYYDYFDFLETLIKMNYFYIEDKVLKSNKINDDLGGENLIIKNPYYNK